MPLYSVDYVVQWIRQVKYDSLKEFSQLISIQVKEPCQEQKILHQIKRLTPITDDISQKVMLQYRENPYPRWINISPRRPKSFASQFRTQIFPNTQTATPNLSAPDILVAGCGTGKQPIATSLHYKGCHVLAVDLSLTSLAYAKRKSQELSITNLEFLQADILDLAKLNRTFDLIECSGVLHHMDDPMKGWRILVHLLRPGGFFNIGLYSSYAQKHIVAAGSFVQERGYKPTASDIRKCRKELLAQPDNSILKKVTDSRDFYSISGTRDLIFHTRECHFTIPQILDALNEFRLSFLGFHFEDKTIVKKYLNRFSDDPYAVSLSNWNEFEMENPDTFRHMYRFWTQKTPG